MAQRIWYTGTDGGDGSIGVSFYESQECIELLEEEQPEYYRGEGGSWFEVPDGVDVVGIEVQTLAQVREELDLEAEDEE